MNVVGRAPFGRRKLIAHHPGLHHDGNHGSLGAGQASGSAMKPFADVLERVSDDLVALDKDWLYTYVNSQAAALFGRWPEDLVGRHIWTEFPEGVGHPFHLAYERAMAEQVFIHVESCYEPWNRWF